jgi:hypothetical protein
LALVPLALTTFVLTLGAPTAQAVSTEQVTGGETRLFAPMDVTFYFALADTPEARFFIYGVGNSGIYTNVTRYGLSGNELSYDIGDGLIEADTMIGTVNHPGGIQIAKWTPGEDGIYRISKTLDVTKLRIVNGNTLVGDAAGILTSPAGQLVNPTHHRVDPVTGDIRYEAKVQLDLINATVLNTYFETDIFTDGLTMGYLISDIETEPLP